MRNSLSKVLLLVVLLPLVQVTAQRSNFFPPGNVQARMRVIVDNDFSGDPDGLFQLVHQLLSPSAEIRAIIGSHLKPGDPFDHSDKTASNAAGIVKDLLAKMQAGTTIPVLEGSNTPLLTDSTPIVSPAVNAIIREAMREDTKLPLYMLCGAGLTDIASACLLEPRIAQRMTLIWIGGPEYADLALPPPNYTSLEYNLGIDIRAVQVVFNRTGIPIWQVPRSTYRQALLSYAELLAKIKPQGAIGAYLAGKLENLMQLILKFNAGIGETYILGDSPLVLLTALQSSFEADPSSSKYALRPAPRINDAGLYEVNAGGRNIRVYHQLDTRLMFEDLFAKLTLFNLPR